MDCYVESGYWDAGYTEQDVCGLAPATEVRQPGGFLPVIYVDRHGRPVGLDDLREQAIEAAPDQPEVEAALDAVEAAQDGPIDAAALDVMAAQFRILAGLLAELDAALARDMMARAKAAELRAEDERDVEILMMAI